MNSDVIDLFAAMRTLSGMNKDTIRIVQDALAGVITTHDVTALADVLHDDFVHHRPDSPPSSKAEWLAAVRAVPLTALRVQILHVLSDGDFVVMHSRRWLEGGGPGIAGVDIWRFAEGRIAEGWEVIEPVEDAAAHMLWWRSVER